MVAAENFVAELDTKNQTSIQRVVDALSAAIGKDGVEVPDALRFALKATIESAEVAALWIPDCDDLEMKLSLAEQCGDVLTEALDVFPGDVRVGIGAQVEGLFQEFTQHHEPGAAGDFPAGLDQGLGPFLFR